MGNVEQPLSEVGCCTNLHAVAEFQVIDDWFVRELPKTAVKHRLLLKWQWLLILHHMVAPGL
ncbi:hypothetical protein AWB98_29295 [Mycolicibacterium conceptionense]|uniref:Uncharacterized protein n=1 Tax=Mycolicibacterium conceptionense TaxID=451644 RepID=A0ABX3UXY4_9MYCO|nr:hypothetical protein AWB98_29295 [Mycolicibacterium conceptionense]